MYFSGVCLIQYAGAFGDAPFAYWVLFQRGLILVMPRESRDLSWSSSVDNLLIGGACELYKIRFYNELTSDRFQQYGGESYHPFEYEQRLSIACHGFD